MNSRNNYLRVGNDIFTCLVLVCYENCLLGGVVAGGVSRRGCVVPLSLGWRVLSFLGFESRVGEVRYVTSRYDVRVSNICLGYRGGLLGVERRERIL